MLSQFILILGAAAFLGLTARQARLTDHDPAQRPRLIALWSLLLASFVGYVVLSYTTTVGLVTTDPAAAAALGLDEGVINRGLPAIGLAVVLAAYLEALVVFPAFRRHLAPLFPAPKPVDLDQPDLPWQAQVRGFDITRNVHIIGLGAVLLFLGQTITDYILAGGQEGLLPQVDQGNRFILSSLLTMIVFIGLSGTGVGAGQDRDWRAVANRLGLRLPNWQEALVAAGTAILLVAFQMCAALIWWLLSSEELFQQQTQVSQAIAGSVTSLSMAFLLALFSAMGEEIAFRGTLQPALGIWPPAILFALAHIQYQLTPAALIILIVGVMLGLVRKYFGTASAIMTHFLYNFTLFTLAYIASQLPQLPMS